MDDNKKKELAKQHSNQLQIPLINSTDSINMANLIKISFPSISEEFISVLFQYFKNNKFTKERALLSINHVICNNQFSQPKIAEFINFDKSITEDTNVFIPKDNYYD